MSKNQKKKSKISFKFQGKSIESIQEYCLDELLGISKKRLLSIINATQCPSDTESSEESDCKNVDEHISLEEISSDSGEEGVSKRKKLRKKARSAKVTTEKKNGAKPPKKEYSVLELLELQARARAIRSQLALEPVTKIELDSDNSDSSSESDKDENKKSKEAPTPAGSKDAVAKESQPKRVRLVRNFRKRNSDEEEEEQQNNESKKDSSPKRDSSPEVVTIIPEREILCISSDSDDEEKTVAPNADKEEIKVEKEELEAAKEIPIVEEIPKEPGTPEDGEILEEEEAEKIVEEKTIEEDIFAPLEVEIPEPEEKKETPETSLEEKLIELNNMDDTLLVHVDMDELNDEMTENFEEPEQPPKSKSPEIFEIGDSSEEENEKEKLIQKELTATSFHERWLESKKVSKILATSRLANRVREKLKQKNKKQSESDNSEVSSPTPTDVVPEVVPSNCEEGSVSHFEEIGTTE